MIAVGDQPVIHRLGPFVTISSRHHLQQGLYLCCAAQAETGWKFTPFVDGLTGFDLRRLLIPKFAREEILRRLLAMNMNPYSLSSGSIDALVKSEWLKNKSKHSYVPNVIVIESTMDYTPIDDGGFWIAQFETKYLSGWRGAQASVNTILGLTYQKTRKSKWMVPTTHDCRYTI